MVCREQSCDVPVKAGMKVSSGKGALLVGLSWFWLVCSPRCPGCLATFVDVRNDVEVLLNP